MSTAAYDPERFYLALDTSGPTGWVAVGVGGRTLAGARMDRTGEHAGRLAPTIADVLEEARVAARELAGVIVGEGPGSFTGVRVAAATAKGLVHALGVPLWSFSSLAAGAIGGGDLTDGIRYVLFDARGDRVYGGCYGVGSVGVREMVAPHFAHLRDLLAGDVPPGAVFVGSGAVRHERAIEALGFPVADPPLGVPAASALLRLLALHPDTPALESPATWEPRYLRASNAERARTG